MSGQEEVLFVDTRSINALLAASGESGLDTLLLGGRRVMISQNVIREIELGPPGLAAKFDAWYQSNLIDNAVPGENHPRLVFNPDYILPDGAPAGNQSLRDLAAANKSQYLARFLSDDSDFYLVEKNATTGFRPDSLAARGEALDERVLLRLAGLNVIPVGAGGLVQYAPSAGRVYWTLQGFNPVRATRAVPM